MLRRHSDPPDLPVKPVKPAAPKAPYEPPVTLRRRSNPEELLTAPPPPAAVAEEAPPKLTRQAKPPRVSAPATAAHSRPWGHIAIAAATALLLLACFSPAFQSDDAWFHLRTGQYLMQKSALPTPDPFTYTGIGDLAYPTEEAVRYFNLTRAWLAQAAMYLAYSLGGFPLLVLLRALLMSAASALTGLVAWRRSGSFHSAVGAALLSAILAYRFADDRPLLLTFLFLAIVMAALQYRRLLWGLPLVFVFWANCDEGFFLGWIPLIACSVEALFRRRKGLPETGDRQLWMITAASILASALNPNILDVFPTLFDYRQSSIPSLPEWQTTPLWPISPFVVVVAVAAALLLVRRKQARLADWLILAPFAAAGFYANSFAICMAVIGPAVIAASLPWQPKALPRKWEFAMAALLAAAIMLPVWQKRAFQFTTWDETRPTGAIAFLRDHRVTGTLFNPYEHAGYLTWRLWPQMRVFVDGRGLNERIFQDYRRIVYNSPAQGESGVLRLLDRYGVQTLMVTGYDYATGRPHYLINLLIDQQQTEWKLVFHDAQAMVFMRRLPPDVLVQPKTAGLTSMESQCTVHVELVPAEPLCALETSRMFERLGDRDRAREWGAFYQEHR